jgi:hypothetical protein
METQKLTLTRSHSEKSVNFLAHRESGSTTAMLRNVKAYKAAMTEKEHLTSPWWATLKILPYSHPTVLGITDRLEKADFEMLS